jgi:hypothetical protein
MADVAAEEKIRFTSSILPKWARRTKSLKQGELTLGSIADVAGIAVAVTTRTGAPKPDISSPDALKRSSLAAESIVYADPAGEGRIERRLLRARA